MVAFELLTSCVLLQLLVVFEVVVVLYRAQRVFASPQK